MTHSNRVGGNLNCKDIILELKIFPNFFFHIILLYAPARDRYLQSTESTSVAGEAWKTTRFWTGMTKQDSLTFSMPASGNPPEPRKPPNGTARPPPGPATQGVDVTGGRGNQLRFDKSVPRVAPISSLEASNYFNSTGTFEES
jgi:hypothetical protein